MALTKISTGGVKDDAASQAKIADEAVDEARLQISNAGTNGQFLQKQSGNTGGLTWSDVPAQYTHPNHSGEVTSTADGAQVIASNVVDEDNLKVSNSPTNGQLLSAQSGNTGGLTWTDAPSSAPQITATADGAITAGQPIIIKSDGDVAQVKLNITINNPPTVTSARTELTSSNFDKISALYIPELKKIVVAGKNENSGDDLEMAVGEVDDTGSFTWGNITEIETDRLAGDPGLVYDPATQRLIVLYYCDGMSNPEYSIFSRVLTLSGNTISNIGSRTTLWNQDGGSFWGTKLVYDPDNQKIVAVYRRGGGNNPYSAVGTVTGGSTNTVSWGTPVQITSESTGMLDATYDPDTNRVLMVTRGPSNVIDAFVGTVSGTSISWGSAQEVLASSGNLSLIHI